MSIESLISKNKLHVFRRMFMKRRISGNYEAIWQTIPSKYIINYGSVGFSIDDIKVNFYQYDGLSFKVRNEDGYFSDISETKSFFYGAETRYRTLLKIESGYLDSASTEYPTSTIMYIGLLNEDLIQNQQAVINFSTKHLSSIFQEVPAENVGGLGSTMTASQILTKIMNHTDGASNIIFQKYISAGGWNIATTTNYYNMATSTSLQGLTCWELMQKLAEAENMVLYISRDGDFYFQAKEPLTTTAIYHFKGLGDKDNTYGTNIKETISLDYGLRKVYNRVRIKFDESDTLTSYYVYKENWTWGDSSSSYLYGVKTYEYNNEWINGSATAQTIASAIYNEYKYPKLEVKIQSKFVPHLNLNDRVSLNYKARTIEGDYLWDYAIWDNFYWQEASGYNININQDFRIIKIKHNIDNFSSELELREI